MNVAELIDHAKLAAGSLGLVAEKIGKSQSRISEWKKGIGKPSATDIMLMAEIAGLPALDTLAQVESELEADHASVWQRALGNLRAAGVAATVILGLAIFSMLTPKDAFANVPVARCLHTAGVTGSIPVPPTRFA